MILQQAGIYGWKQEDENLGNSGYFGGHHTEDAVK